MFEGIKDALHREIGELEDKFATGAKMSGQELEHIDKMAHALKCLATYEAMTGGYTRKRYYEPDGYSRRY